MSLVNKMLKDLSERERVMSDPMRGLDAGKSGAGRGGLGARIVGLVVISAVVLGGLWYVYGPKKHAIPQPRAALQLAPSPTGVAPPEPRSENPVAVVAAGGTDGDSGGDPQEAAGAAPAPESAPLSGSLRTRSGLTFAEAFATGQRAHQKGDYEEANRHYSDILIADPTVKEVREALVRLRMEHNRLADARRVLNRGLSLDAEHPPFVALDGELARLERSGADRTMAVSNDVAGALRAGTPADVERELIALLVADRELHAAREALVDMRIEQNRLVDARRSLNIGLRVAPDHPPYLQRDRTLRLLENPRAPASAEVSVPAAPTLSPAQAEAEVLSLLQAGRADDAAQVIRRTSAAHPGWAGYRTLAARVELARGQPARAVALLQPDAPVLSTDPEYHGLLASAYQRTNRHEEASRSYRALLQFQPDEGRWWAGYAISREALGDRESAAQAYAEALRRGNLEHALRSYVTDRLDALRRGE